MTQKLDDQIKAAERDKYIADAERARSEKAKIDLEILEIQTEISKKWYSKKGTANLLKQLIAVTVLLAGFLTFFIPYVVYPVFNKDNIALSTQNYKTSDSLFKAQKRIDIQNSAIIAEHARLDSEFKIEKLQKRYLDSSKKSLEVIKRLLSFQTKKFSNIISRKNDSLSRAIFAFDYYSRATDSITSINDPMNEWRIYVRIDFVCKGEKVTNLSNLSLYTVINGKYDFYPVHRPENNYSTYNFYVKYSPNKFVLRIYDKRYKLKNGFFEFKLAPDANEIENRGKTHYILTLEEQ